MKIQMKIALILLSGTFLGCSSTSKASVKEIDIIGAWASSISSEGCQTESITYFTSDGSVIIMSDKEGDIHSFGTWKLGDGKLEMTHNHLPLIGTGEAAIPGIYEIVDHSENRLVVVYVAGRYKVEGEASTPIERVKCSNLQLGKPEGGHSH